MKYIIGTLLVIVAIGLLFVRSDVNQARENKEIREFVASRGATKVPRSWAPDIGKGI